MDLYINLGVLFFNVQCQGISIVLNTLNAEYLCQAIFAYAAGVRASRLSMIYSIFVRGSTLTLPSSIPGWSQNPLSHKHHT